MKILFLVHRIPYPPNKGEKIRAFHQIRQLSQKHTVHLACLVDEQEDLQHLKTLEKCCASVDVVYRDKTLSRLLAVLALFTNRPLSVASFYSRKLAKRVAQRLSSERFDSIFVFSSVMAEYVRHVSGIPRVMDFVDVDSAKWQMYADSHSFPFSWVYRLEAGRLARYEEEVARVFEHSLFVSDKEAFLFQQRVDNRPISVIPNGVDLNYFVPNSTRHLGPALVFTGAMDYFPNIDAMRFFCSEIFPLVREVLPEARFYIVGRNPTRRVRELERQPQVIVTGSVPDVRPYLAKVMVAVAPFRIARGVQNKVLEAMAMGLPVVGTSIAFQGIQATRADGIRIADDPQKFAQEVLSFLEDPGLRRQCSLQARHYVQRCHQWRDHGVRLESVLQETIGERAFHDAHGGR